jgi:hypothetical protein
VLTRCAALPLPGALAQRIAAVATAEGLSVTLEFTSAAVVVRTARPSAPA